MIRLKSSDLLLNADSLYRLRGLSRIARIFPNIFRFPTKEAKRAIQYTAHRILCYAVASLEIAGLDG